MSRRFLFLGILVLVLVLSIFLCRQHWIDAKQINVLLITLDTTRADHLGCYGYRPSVTPALDQLASDGVLFERSYCPTPLTLPSHTTILTGLHPPEHGIRINVSTSLPDELPYLPEILASNGYVTAAFIASPVLAQEFGLARGFDVYDDNVPEDDQPGHPALHPYRPGNSVVDAATAWLTENGNKQFFCWVHLYDPHYPYEDHSDLFGDRFTDTPYVAEIAFVDTQIQRLLNTLKRAGKRERTLVVVVGDHGESLDGEHNEPRPFHGYMLYDSTMHVPLIFSWPGTIKQGRRVRHIVSLVDLFPTILRLLSIAAPNNSGHDLYESLNGNQDDGSQVCYGETEYPSAFGWSPLQSLTTERWKFVRTPRTELYNITTDPREQHNLAGEMPEKVKELDQQLRSMEDAMSLHTADAVRMTPAEQRRIQSLGYVAGGSAAGATSAAQKSDIKDMVSVITMSYEAEELSKDGNHRQALRLWKKIVKRSPTSFAFRNSLGLSLLENGSERKAVNTLQSLLLDMEEDVPHGPRNKAGREHRLYPILLNNLAFAKTEQRKFVEALALVKRAIKIDPFAGAFHHTLAIACKGMEQIEDAHRSALMAVSLEPRNPEHILFLAELEMELGHKDKAAELALSALGIQINKKQRRRARTLLDQIHSKH